MAFLKCTSSECRFECCNCTVSEGCKVLIEYLKSTIPDLCWWSGFVFNIDTNKSVYWQIDDCFNFWYSIVVGDKNVGWEWDCEELIWIWPNSQEALVVNVANSKNLAIKSFGYVSAT